MKILLSPQVNEDKVIIYTFSGEIVTATLDGVTDTFDFSSFPDGDLDRSTIVTTLAINPIMSAQRENGVLEVEVLNFIKKDATEDEKFPQWKGV
jgi:hypothetical protein